MRDLEPNEVVEEKINVLFDNAADAIKRIKSKNTSTELKDLLTISHMIQIEKIAVDWTDYTTITSNILQKKRRITVILDGFFNDKLSFISKTGRIMFLNKYRTELDLENLEFLMSTELSSGEKQLYIFLMEALLQHEQPSIFIADEPELSLHILWQEKLVSAMRNLNDKAQIIFATHSPDLVGPFSDAIFDMDPTTGIAEVERGSLKSSDGRLR